MLRLAAGGGALLVGRQERYGPQAQQLEGLVGPSHNPPARPQASRQNPHVLYVHKYCKQYFMLVIMASAISVKVSYAWPISITLTRYATQVVNL